MISSVTVYCSSSDQVDPLYRHAATQLGAAIAAQRWTLVYGGNYCGCMASLADGARSARGKVVGITPKLLAEKVSADDKCDELLLTDSMRERKAHLEQRGDAFVTLPGGIGTFEEFFEILVARYLGFHEKPLVLLNINGFYDPLLELLKNSVESHFIRPRALQSFHVAHSVDETISHLLRHAHDLRPLNPQAPRPVD